MPDARGQKAFLEVVHSRERLPCLFNPSELEITRSNIWTTEPLPGQGVRRLRYQGAGSGKLRLELFFDTTDTGKPVTDHTNKLLKLMDVDPKITGTAATKHNSRPPLVAFHWGTMSSFKAVVSDLRLSFVYFSSTGVPLRARLELLLMQYEEAAAYGPQNPTSGTPHPHRVHRVLPGETLDRIAAQHYGDATRWREVARANGVRDPLSLRPGSTLSIPELDG